MKPANFLLVGGMVKLIDFGIAKTISADRTSATCEQQVGTLNYMSPEALQDTQTDAQEDRKSRFKVRALH